MKSDKMMAVVNKAADFAKRVGAFALPFIAAVAFDKGKDYVTDKLNIGCVKNYDDVVRIILDSDMFSSTKQEAIELLKVGEDVAYYKTIARIVLSSAYSSTKIDMIKNINTKNLEGS